MTLEKGHVSILKGAREWAAFQQANLVMVVHFGQGQSVREVDR